MFHSSNLTAVEFQIMFCGGAGFVEDFVRPSVLEMMLDWQREDGCYAPYDGSHLPEAIALHSKKSRERLASFELEILIINHNYKLLWVSD